MRWFGKGVFTVLAFTVAIGAAAQDTSAQRNKRKKRPVAPVVASPTLQPQTEPVVVSRADEFQDNSSALPPQPVYEAAPVSPSPNFSDIETRIKQLESQNKNDYDTRQKRLMLNLDILTRAEQRTEALRKQSFELAEKEAGIRTKLDTLEIEGSSEKIDREVAFAGTLRPEEMRAARQKAVNAEKTNLTNLLNQIVQTRSSIDQNLLRADQMVERLRSKLEKDIDDAIADEQQP